MTRRRFLYRPGATKHGRVCRSVTALLILALAGCAHEPAFRAELPGGIDTAGSTMAIIGDLQLTSGLVRFVRQREDNSEAQQILIDDLAAHTDQLNALAITGDLVYTARSDRHWEHFDTLMEPFIGRVPLLPAIGNHDYPCYLVQFCRSTVMARGMAERFPWMVPGEPYSVDAGELLLLFLDSESQYEQQAAWLRRSLREAADDYRAALVFFHRPAFSNSVDRGAKGNVDLQQFIVPVLNESPVSVVVFSGHIHGYEYIVRDGVHYITTGGGGGPRGPMADQRPYDLYRGEDCPRASDGALLRPLNYVLLNQASDRLLLEVRGLCDSSEAVRTLDRVEIPL